MDPKAKGRTLNTLHITLKGLRINNLTPGLEINQYHQKSQAEIPTLCKSSLERVDQKKIIGDFPVLQVLI
ncbi:hypothetical protein Pfo_014104 [Paulownia fortunei]|nr:hypothetical protein Pfo_014104 [Paulownia fortunei]